MTIRLFFERYLHFFPLRHANRKMSRNYKLDEEFSSIMAASRNRQTIRGPVNAVSSSIGGTRHANFATPPGGSQHDHNDQSMSFQPSIQAVRSSLYLIYYYNVA